MRRLSTVLLTLALVTAASYGGASLISTKEMAAYGGTADPIEVDRLIGVFERRVAEHGDPVNVAHLGTHLLTRASMVGSLDDYRAARTAFESAATRMPTRPVLLGLANSTMALHDFESGRITAERLLELDPLDPAAHLIIGDSWLELGDVNRAVEAFNRVADTTPGDPALIVRRAEVAHLTGHQELAIDLAHEAHRAARRLGLSGQNLAFYPLLRADLLFDAGAYRDAREQVSAAVALAPDWAPVHASHGKVLAASGDTVGAVAAYERALSLQPDDPGWLASLGDLAAVRGLDAEADTYYQQAIQLYAEEDPAIYGQNLATLYADRDMNHLEAVSLSADDLNRRESIGNYDTYAWALFRAGRLQEARAASDEAMRMGTQDGELQFHAAMISAALGERDRAIGELASLLTTNPQFHPVHASTAAALLESLRLT